jgi:hypothetical protein
LTDQAKVVQFAYRLDARRKLSGGELSALAQQMVDAASPAEAARIRASIVQGARRATLDPALRDWTLNAQGAALRALGRGFIT